MIRYAILLVLCLLLQDQCNFANETIDAGVLDLVQVENQGNDTEALLKSHPLAFLKKCLERYEREVQGYSTKFIKRERIAGNLKPLEKIEVFFRENPFSVYFDWIEGAGMAQKVLYVKGENENKLLARGSGALKYLPVFAKAVDGAEAKNNGRYPIDQFGIYLGTKRSVASMEKAQQRGQLYLKYEGIFKVAELGDRQCYKLVRTPYVPLEDEGVYEYTLFIDTESWLQIGSVLKDASGNLIAEYFFRDLKINPVFKKDQFTRASL
jgi:hypothetical protein